MGGENDLKAVELLTLREEGEGEEEEERWGRLGPLGFYGPTDTHGVTALKQKLHSYFRH